MSDEKQDLSALRKHLFDAIAGVKSGDLEIEKARAINEIGKTLVDTARVEIDYLKANGGGESNFLDQAVGSGNLPPGITGVRQHRLR